MKKFNFSSPNNPSSGQTRDDDGITGGGFFAPTSSSPSTNDDPFQQSFQQHQQVGQSVQLSNPGNISPIKSGFTFLLIKSS